MLNIEKKTKLRFKTCDGNDYSEWKEIQIGKILTERKEFSEKNKNYPHFSLTKEGVVPKSERYERDFLVKNIKKTYKITHLNDICYNPANLKFGVIAKNDLGSGIFSPIYITFTVHKEVNPTYLDLYIRYSDFIKRARRYEEGTVYERKAVQPSDFIKVKITVPCLEEQNKIAEFFSKFDELIAFYKKNLEIAQKLKKGFLQKLFPQKDNKVPELRFPGFADAWEQREVRDLLVERNEKSPKTDEFPLMAFIANKGVAEKGEKYDRSALVNDTENKLYKKTKKGDFIYSSNNLETGSIGLNTFGNACISPVYSIFYPTGATDSDFIGRRFTRKDFINSMIKWRQGVVYGQWRIHESDFLKINILVPTYEEQLKIGAFFKRLDSNITLHQRKLEILQNIKKGFFQQMFV